MAPLDDEVKYLSERPRILDKVNNDPFRNDYKLIDYSKQVSSSSGIEPETPPVRDTVLYSQWELNIFSVLKIPLRVFCRVILVDKVLLNLSRVFFSNYVNCLPLDLCGENIFTCEDSAL